MKFIDQLDDTHWKWWFDELRTKFLHILWFKMRKSCQKMFEFLCAFVPLACVKIDWDVFYNFYIGMESVLFDELIGIALIKRNYWTGSNTQWELKSIKNGIIMMLTN